MFQTVDELANEMVHIGNGEEITLLVMVNRANVDHEQLMQVFEDTIEREQIYGTWSISDSVNCIGSRSFVSVTFSR